MTCSPSPQVILRSFASAHVGSGTLVARRPIKDTSRTLQSMHSLKQAFWPAGQAVGDKRYFDFLEQNPLAVVGGVTDAEREAR